MHLAFFGYGTLLLLLLPLLLSMLHLLSAKNISRHC